MEILNRTSICGEVLIRGVGSQLSNAEVAEDAEKIIKRGQKSWVALLLLNLCALCDLCVEITARVWFPLPQRSSEGGEACDTYRA